MQQVYMVVLAFGVRQKKVKKDASVKSRFRLRYEIVKTLRIAADPLKRPFLGFSGPFDRQTSFAKLQNQAETQPYWPFRIRFLAFSRMPMLAKYSSRLSSVRSNGILADYHVLAADPNRYDASGRCWFLRFRREFDSDLERHRCFLLRGGLQGDVVCQCGPSNSRHGIFRPGIHYETHIGCTSNSA